MAAIPLVRVDNGKFIVSEDALRRLSLVEGDIGVIGIAGLARTGKSYLLNRLLGRQDGFDVGPTINPCTKGIYVWGEPISLRTPTGRQIKVLLIDTEGIGSVQAHTTHDAKIFALTLLLSSYFIYNSVGTINEGAVDKLSFVANLTKHIRIRSSSTPSQPDDINDFAQEMPDFLWLLRDFALLLEDESGHPITSRHYLERSLRLHRTDDLTTEQQRQSLQSRNQVRQAILSLFPHLDCETLVRPVVDETQLRSVDKVPSTQLRVEFLQQIGVLKRKIFASVKPKVINGCVVTTQAWIGLLQQYVAAINGGAVPTVASAWESVVLNECQKAIKQALSVYKSTILPRLQSSELPLDEDLLAKYLKDARQAALNKFYALAIGSKEEHKEHLMELEAEIEKTTSEVHRRNTEESTSYCRKLINDVSVQLETKLEKDQYSLNSEGLKQLQNELSSFLQYFYSTGRGPAKTNPSTVSYFLEKVNLVQYKFVLKLSLAHEQSQEVFQQQKNSIEKLTVERNQLLTQVKSLNENMKDLSNERQIIKVELDSYRKKLEDSEFGSTSRTRQLEKQLEIMRHQLEELRTEKKSVEQSLSQVQVQFEASLKEKSAETQRLREILDQLEGEKSEYQLQVQKHINEALRIEEDYKNKHLLNSRLLDTQKSRSEEEKKEWQQRQEEEIRQKEDQHLQERVQLQREVAMLQEQIQVLKRENSQLKTNQSSSTTSFLAQQTEQEMSSLKEKVDQLKKELIMAGLEKDRLEADLRRERLQLQMLRSEPQNFDNVTRTTTSEFSDLKRTRDKVEHKEDLLTPFQLGTVQLGNEPKPSLFKFEAAPKFTSLSPLLSTSSSTSSSVSTPSSKNTPITGWKKDPNAEFISPSLRSRIPMGDDKADSVEKKRKIIEFMQDTFQSHK